MHAEEAGFATDLLFLSDPGMTLAPLHCGNEPPIS
jgi:hypothetical protein